MKKEDKWTLFWDMHSGGELKEEPYSLIFIEAPKDVAKIIFYNRFGHNPERVTCTCCGKDYSIDESESLEQSSGYHRNCRYAYMKNGKEITQEEGWKIGKGIVKGVWGGYIEEKRSFGDYQTMKEFEKRKDILIIREEDIKSNERIGNVPVEGYVWQ